jgi:hypothetical protein
MTFKENLERSVKITAVIMLIGSVFLVVLFINATSGKPADKPASVVVKVAEPDFFSTESNPASRRYPGAEYVTEKFTGDGTRIIFTLKGSYDDAELRVNGRITTVGPYGNCLTVEACYDYGKGRIIFNVPPAKGSVITFTGTIL